MASFIGATVIMLVVVGTLVGWAVREDRRLRRAADRYRELQFEGIEELERNDPYPEFEGGGMERIVEPGGEKVEARPLLQRELAIARDYMRWQREPRRNGKEQHARHH